jgi:hypothetical protein
LRQIENALRAAEHEQSGLNERVGDVLARVAVTLGNGTDEYIWNAMRATATIRTCFQPRFQTVNVDSRNWPPRSRISSFENGHVEPVSGFQAASRRVSSLRATHLPHHWTSTLEENCAMTAGLSVGICRPNR